MNNRMHIIAFAFLVACSPSIDQPSAEGGGALPCARCAEVAADVRDAHELCGISAGDCSTAADDGELSACLWGALGACACQGSCADVCASACATAQPVQAAWLTISLASSACVTCLQRSPAPGDADAVRCSRFATTIWELDRELLG